MWYYAQGNQRVGPVSFEEMARLLALGAIGAHTLVWSEGMEAWRPLGTTPLAEQAPAGAEATVPASTLALRTEASPPPSDPYYATSNPPLAQPDPEAESRSLEELFKWSWILWIAGFLCCVPWLGAAILGYILLYKHWVIISDGRVRTSPGMAVGLCFVPFFNFYWVFVAYHGLTQDMNAYCRRHDIPAPPANESLALTYCILHVCYLIPYLGVLFMAVNIVVLILLHKSLKETSQAILRDRLQKATIVSPGVTEQPEAPNGP